MKRFGIDISAWQKNFSIGRAMSDYGVQFCIIKAGGADAGYYTDKYFSRNYNECEKLGLSKGCYYFSQAMTMERAKKEVEHFLKIIKGKRFDYPIFMDYEAKVLQLSKRALTDIAKYQLKVLQDAGYWVGIYTSESHFNDHFYDEELKNYSHWVANYAAKEPPKLKYSATQMWQCGGERSAVVDTKMLGQTVDQNYCYIDYPTRIKDKGLNGYTKVTQKPVESAPTDAGGVPIIALDAGHGMYTAGNRCLKSIDSKETREWFLNDRIVDKVETALKSYNCKVLRVDDTTGTHDISLTARVNAANNSGATFYLSVHHDSGIKGGKGGGTTVHYCSSNKNRPVQAEKLYACVTDKTKLYGNRASKVVYSNLYVLNKTKMPALLLENGFMDSSVDTPIILTESHATNTASGIVDFLVSELKLSAVAPQVSVTSAYYPKYTGAPTGLAKALASIGVDSSYTFRSKIAAANDIKGYIGTTAQNTTMYNMLVAGVLKKA